MPSFKAIVTQYGISRAHAYNALKAAGIDPGTLRDADGNLTADGVQQITAVLDRLPSIRLRASNAAYASGTQPDADTAANDQRIIDELRQDRDEQHERAILAEAQLSAQRLLTDGLNAQLDKLEQRHREELDRLTAAYAGQIDALRAEVEALRPRRSWWARIRKKG